MDHKLALVLVPKGTADPVGRSRELLSRFQRPGTSEAGESFEPRFRYKRVGGWFDGMSVGLVGQERWSTVLRMLLDGTPTNAASPFPGSGTETLAQIERRIEADNTFDLDDVWPLAPCSIVVTPEGKWIAHAAPDHLDDASCNDELCVSWARTRRALLYEHRGAIAVAWDLSWHFIGLPSIDFRSRRRGHTRVRGEQKRSTRHTAFSSARIESAHSAPSPEAEIENEEIKGDADAVDRWTGEGGAVAIQLRA